MSGLFRSWMRHPIRYSVGLYVILLITLSTILDVGADVRDRWWATALVLVGIFYSVALAFWLYRKPIPPELMTQMQSVFGTTAYVIAGGLVTLGAAAWTLWVAFAVTGLHLGYLTWYLRRRPAPASS